MKEIICTIKECIIVSIRSSVLYTIVRIFSSLIKAIISVVSIYIDAAIINQISRDIGKSKISTSLIFLMLLLATMTIFNVIIEKVELFCQVMHEELIDNYLKEKIMNIGNEIDLEFFDSSQYRDSIEKYKSDTEIIGQLLWNIITLIQLIVILIGTLFIVIKISPSFVIVIFTVVLPVAILNRKFINDIYTFEIDSINNTRKMYYIQDLFNDKRYAMDIRFYNIGKNLIKKYSYLWSQYFYEKRKINKKKSICEMILYVLPYICLPLMMLFIISKIILKKQEIGYYSLCYAAIIKLIYSIRNTFDCVYQIYESKLKIENIKKFNSYFNKITSGSLDVMDKNMEIEFKNVYFKYPMADKEILTNVSFKVKNGEHVALIGQNGSGKSTIIKLLLRFYDVDEGEILINGRNIKTYDVESLRNKISIFFQESNIYGFSLAYNISMSFGNVKNNVIDKLFEECNANDIIQMANHNLDVELIKSYGKDAIELSGGQKQKIALLRTFYRNANLFILDEPSAYLDPISENEFLKCLDQNTKDKTTIFITHRMSTLKYAEKIIVLEKGNVVGFGSHDHLITNSSQYREIYYAQE